MAGEKKKKKHMKEWKEKVMKEMIWWKLFLLYDSSESKP